MRSLTILVRLTVCGLVGLVVVSCGDDKDDSNNGPCSVAEQSGCDEGLVCQEVAGGEPACFCSTESQTGCAAGLACEETTTGNSECYPPIVVTGRVFDLATDKGIAGALVVARDANDAAASTVEETGAEGVYRLRIPTIRDEDGNPIETLVRLRADASGYLTFPTAPRVAIPVDVSVATGDPPVVTSAATDIALIALEDSTGLGTVSGTVIADNPGGTLVVAGGTSGDGGGVTGVADADGHYTVFNVPAGNVGVRGYLAGLQLDTATAEVQAGENTAGVDLTATGEATAIVSGKIELVNATARETSVILAVDETFVEDAARGEAPPGLRVGGVAGDFEIAAVPDGRYVVLAAFENDQLVRDPDVSIGGTSIVRVTVSGSNVVLDSGFKVTQALDVISPSNEQRVSATPTLEWSDDSGEDHYEVRVFDAFGNNVWEKLDVPGVSGSSTVSVTYAGPALESGSLYQFRATSIKRGGSPISLTEDLKGVFVVE